MDRSLLSRIAVALAAVLLSAAVGACTGKPAEGAKKTDSSQGDAGADEAVPVEVVTLQTGEIESVLRFSANLEAERDVAVLSRTAGQVRRLMVEEGDEAAQGAVLLRIEDEEPQSQLAQTKNDLARAQREFDQQKRLHEQGVASDQMLDTASYERKRLELLLRDAQRAVRYTVVRAPIAGTITQRLVKRGDYVSPNQPLFQVTDFDSLVTRVFVPEKELARLASGQFARLTAPATGDVEHRGQVARIAPQVDPQSGTVKVTIDVPRTSGLTPGMFVDVALVTERHEDAVLLPKRALVYDNDIPYAFKLDGPDRVTRVRVDVALESRLHIEPASGFRAGDRVVIAGQVGLKDGAEVAPTAAPGDPAAESADGERARGGSDDSQGDAPSGAAAGDSDDGAGADSGDPT